MTEAQSESSEQINKAFKILCESVDELTTIIKDLKQRVEKLEKKS